MLKEVVLCGYNKDGNEWIWMDYKGRYGLWITTNRTTIRNLEENSI